MPTETVSSLPADLSDGTVEGGPGEIGTALFHASQACFPARTALVIRIDYAREAGLTFSRWRPADMTEGERSQGHQMIHPVPALSYESALSEGIILADAAVTLAGRPVLRGITLHLKEHRIGIVGRNGSGKSTLLRLLSGLIAPDKGHVRVEGIDPTRERKAMLAHLGILFQNPDHQILFPTVEEELAFGLVQMGVPKAQAQARVTAELARHGRSHWRGASVATLSQGQRHWLCLQSVLLMQPRTILLDEPLAGLDLPTQMRLARTFSSLPQRLITITHDPANLSGCDRVIWLEGGAVAADGPPVQVLPLFQAEMARLGDLDADADLAG